MKKSKGIRKDYELSYLNLWDAVKVILKEKL